MKRFFGVALLAFAVVSCDEIGSALGDSTGNSGSTGGGNGNDSGDGSGGAIVTLPYVDPADRIVAKTEFGVTEFYEYNSRGLLSKITKIRPHYEHENGVVITTTRYEYEGLLVRTERSVQNILPGEIELYTDAGNTVFTQSEYVYDRRRSEGILNASGRFASVTNWRAKDDGSEDMILSSTTTYTYSSDGFLAGEVEVDAEYGYTNSGTMGWKNGNPEWIDFGDGERYTCSYREEEYAWPGINIYHDLDATDMYGDVDITGLDGKKFTNLLSRVSATNPETGESVWMEMVYTFDSKGRVKTVNSKWHEEGEDYYDEEDAVIFHYGDDTDIPEPIDVPAYLLRQECGNVELNMYSSGPSSYYGFADGYSVCADIRNIFSDGTISTGRYVKNGTVSMAEDMFNPKDMTESEFAAFRNCSAPELSLRIEEDEVFGAEVYLVAEYPSYGEMLFPLAFSQNLYPHTISLYDPSKREDPYSSDYYEHKENLLSERFLLPKFSLSRSLEELPESSDYFVGHYEATITVSLNLWPGIVENPKTYTRRGEIFLCPDE